ncbi:MAG TPA: monovalent cation/H+ antiporter complex subunit F [Microthrixaceae bacterium]|jgi:multicomponent Na+:H+ antiporter subunit F|nr:monovalent cation/H+ antiporter complex subunit F [Microthrixaceae bacterium]
MTTIAFAALGIAALCFTYRLVAGPTLSDRVIGLDGLVIVGVSAVAIRAVITGNGSFLPVLVVVTMVGFVGTAASARFIEARVVDRPDGPDLDQPDLDERAEPER